MTFLPEETINQPDALDKVFQEMTKARKVPMTTKQSKITISIMMADDNGIEVMYADFMQHFPLNAFLKRVDTFPIKYEKRLALWLAMMTVDTNIGGMLLVGYYTQWSLVKEQEKYIYLKRELEQGAATLSTVVERVFPMGIFSTETIHEFWDKQKVKARPDNLIDHYSAQLSFMSQPTPEPEP